jgi:hypothetical protein
MQGHLAKGADLRFRSWRFLIIGIVAVLSGCKGFWDPPPSPKSNSGVFYVLNQKTSQIAGFSIVSGAVRSVSGSPYSLNSIPIAIAVSPNGRFVYVSTIAGIYLFKSESSGTLTLANGETVILPDAAQAMQVAPGGFWLLEAASGEGTLSAIALDSTTGLPADGESAHSVALPSTHVQQIATSPSNSTYPYVFIALGADGTAVIPFSARNANPLGAIRTIPVKSSTGEPTLLRLMHPIAFSLWEKRLRFRGHRLAA